MEPNEILKKIREDKGLTMKEVSAVTGMATSLISDYETGKKAIGMKVAIRFADYYGVSLDYLMGREKSDVLTRLAQEFNLTELEKVIVQAYIAISPKEREKFVRAIEEVAKTPEIQQTTNPSPMVYCGTIGEELERRKREEEATQKGTISKFGVG